MFGGFIFTSNKMTENYSYINKKGTWAIVDLDGKIYEKFRLYGTAMGVLSKLQKVYGNSLMIKRLPLENE